jgi:hypothetical protein
MDELNPNPDCVSRSLDLPSVELPVVATVSRQRHHQGGEGELDRSGYSTSPPPNTAIMKFITAALLSAVSCYTELAAAATGHILTLDPSLSSQHHPSNERRTLSRETARIVIAQRTGVENYHTGKGLSDDEIEAINDYGLSTHMLSASKEDARTFILAFAGEDEVEGEMELLPGLRTCTLTNTPSQLSPKKHRLSPLIPPPQ